LAGSLHDGRADPEGLVGARGGVWLSPHLRKKMIFFA